MWGNCWLCMPAKRAEAAADSGGAAASRTEAAAATAPPGQALLPQMLRSKSEARILQLTDSGSSSMSRSQSMPSSSLLEASRRRLAAAAAAEAAQQAAQQAASDGTAALSFVEQYVQAIKDGNATWATGEVGALFAEDAVMISADRQSFTGRPAIVRRLNQGVETLAKMAGDTTDLPTFELTGPSPAPGGTGGVVLRMAFKRGMHKMAFTMNFTMKAGKISQLHTTRS